MRKTIAILFVFTLLFGSFPRSAHAQPAQSVEQQMGDQTLWYNYGPSQFKEKVFGAPSNEIFGERYTLAQVNWIIHSLTYQSLGSVMACMGKPGDQVDQCFAQQTGKNALASPLLLLARVNDSMYNSKPASGIDYIARKLDKLSPVQSAYAQSGFGFRTLEPLQNLWLAARNVAFGLMSFVIIILAFMIMLRQKISPQVVVSVQSALPKVAVAMVVITFSYAIAGLLVDLAYVVMALFAAILSASGLTQITNITEIFNNLNAPIWGFTGWVEILVALLGAIAVGGVMLGAATAGIGTIVAGVTALLALIFVVMAVVAFFRIFIVLLKAYATAIFLVLGFPFVALLSILSIGPGIGGWVRQFTAQLAVFVGVAVVVALSHLIFWSMSEGLTATFGQGALAGNMNPYRFNTGQIAGQGNGIPQFPAFGGIETSILGFFIGFGILYSAPKIATGLRDQIASGRGAYGFDTLGVMTGSGIVPGSIRKRVSDVQTGVIDNVGDRFNTWRRGRSEEAERRLQEARSRTIGTQVGPQTTGALRQTRETGDAKRGRFS